MVDYDVLQARIVAALRASSGLGYPDPRYGDFLFPTDRSPWRPLAARDMWSCALEVRGCLYRAKVTEPEVTRTYEPHQGAITAWLEAMCRRHGVWHDVSTPEALTAWFDAPAAPSGGMPYDVGWLFEIGGGATPAEKQAFGGELHAFVPHTVLRTEDGPEGDQTILWSTDGGQLDAKGQKCIRDRQRVLERRDDGSLWARSVDGVYSPQQPGAGRRVRTIAALPMLPFEE